MYQQLWGYKVEEKLYLGVREQKRLNRPTTGLYELLIIYRTSGGYEIDKKLWKEFTDA
jgi:hypothetical protein